MQTNTQEAVLSAYIASTRKRTPREAAQDAAGLCRLANSLESPERDRLQQRPHGAARAAEAKPTKPDQGRVPELLAKHLHGWLDKHYTPNAEGYLFINSKGQPYHSENVIRSGVHRAMVKLGIVTPEGVHVGIHSFRHRVTTELLEAGTPIHVVTRMMRHGDSKVPWSIMRTS